VSVLVALHLAVVMDLLLFGHSSIKRQAKENQMSANYTIKLTSHDAKVVGLPDVYLHFAHLTFATVWNSETKRQDIVHGINTFYGGMGEGQQFKTWQEAIHVSLYDYYQCGEEFHDGDTFTVQFQDEQAVFICDGVHVMPSGALA
jgi:hypothetical protein